MGQVIDMTEGKVLSYDGFIAYQAIYDELTRLIGAETTKKATKMTRDGFDKKDPLTSIIQLVKGMHDVFGKNMTNRIIKNALHGKFTDEYLKSLYDAIAEGAGITL